MINADTIEGDEWMWGEGGDGFGMWDVVRNFGRTIEVYSANNIEFPVSAK